jgi:hypothetical protein
MTNHIVRRGAVLRRGTGKQPSIMSDIAMGMASFKICFSGRSRCRNAAMSIASLAATSRLDANAATKSRELVLGW